MAIIGVLKLATLDLGDDGRVLMLNIKAITLLRNTGDNDEKDQKRLDGGLAAGFRSVLYVDNQILWSKRSPGELNAEWGKWLADQMLLLKD